MSEWYIDKGANGIRVAKIENRRVIKFDFELKNTSKSMLGALFIGKAVEVSPKSGMVFVDVGEDKPVVLPLKEKKLTSIKRGEQVMIQITRDPIVWQGKSAHGSRVIKLEMGPIIYSKDGGGLNISKKLDSSDFEFLQSEIKDDESISIRHWANSFDDESILKAIGYLRDKWEVLTNKGMEAPDVLERLVQSITPNDHIYTNDRGIVRKLDELIQECYGYSHQIELLRESSFSEDMEDQWDSLKEPHIPIPGGGELIIEETHALVAVDINSGLLPDSFHDLNRRALRELAHQITLRNLSGIIVVDLAGHIKHPKQLIQSIKSLLDQDTNVHGISTLGLLELSRKCNGASLGQRL